MGNLLFGVAREIITPTVGGQLYGYSPDVYSTTVADDLTVTAFYFEKDEQKALLISVTLCSLQTALVRQIADEVSKVTGVSVHHILLCATHTHSAPNTTGNIGWGDVDHAYCDAILVPRIVAAAEKAAHNPQRVTMHTAVGESYIGINRRETMGNGIGLGQDPDGVFDPTMTIMSFKSETGAVVANLIHYACHGTSAGVNTEITRDWSGVMVDALESATGGVTAFVNGAEGDIGPRLTNGKTVGDLSHVRELGNCAADDALRIFATAAEQLPTLAVNSAEIAIPLKSRMAKAEAERLLGWYKEETVNLGALARHHLEGVLLDWENSAPQEDAFTFRQTVLKLGNVVFTSYPFEPFCEIAMRVKAAFSDKIVLALSNTGGSEGYVVAESELCRGGYEVGMQRYGHRQSLADNADTALVLATIENVNKI